jgi:peptidoglycan/LPS O-acetylase OafA/YrhL
VERHRNNLGLIRLVLASGVIIGHAPEMTDGNALREPLWPLIGTMTLGGFAVHGFFLISGYLICQSMSATKRVGRYLLKRVVRIVPAFVVAYLISAFVIAPALGADIWPHLKAIVLHLAFLREPPPLLKGIEPFYGHINGALWTISYEFRCYLLVALLWMAGAIQRRATILALTAVTVLLSIAISYPGFDALLNIFRLGRLSDLVIGDPGHTIRLTSLFLAGMSVYLYRAEVLPRLTGPIAGC